MPVNKLALLRYKVIDKCLQNRFRKWTLDDLIDAVSDALYEYEGIRTGVSKRTIQLDIQNMRSDKLGYNAPIVVVDRKYYSYADKEYSITKSNVSQQDIDKLTDVVRLLGQFKGFTYFEDISTMIGRLEDKIIQQNQSKESYIDFEKNELLKGLQWIDPILEALKKRQTLTLSYQSFRAQSARAVIVFPYLLKEYRNRWFLLCRSQFNQKVSLYALDRMEAVEVARTIPFVPADFEVARFFDDVIGVTKTQGQSTHKVVLQFAASSAPYVLTKPLHPSQKVLKNEHGELIVQIEVVLNFELEREILGFGESVNVLSPRILKNRILKRLKLAAGLYE